MIAPQLNELSIDQLQDPEVREIVGQLYFRMGMLVNSYRFIEDLKSPNAENIKGNLYVLRGKYELAYAQFKVALEQKQNSQNAMERLLPLAWLLGDWAQGSLYAERVIASPHTQINKLALATAFMIQKGEFSRAINALENINQRSRKGGHRDVTQLYSFAALMENKPSLVKKQAKLSCEQYDLMNCWLQYQLVQWDSFPLTIRRGDDLPARRSWEKLIKEDIHEPLKETVYVNQLDIEELDDKLIKLVPHGH
jgi:tetratricopeptide (TPR) repeat protein